MRVARAASQLAVAHLLAVASLLLVPPMARAQLGSCVARYGQTGCAARVYGQVLCSGFDQPMAVAVMQAELTQQFAQAAIDFSGISAETIETTALRDAVPLFCPQNSARIQELFQASGTAARQR